MRTKAEGLRARLGRLEKLAGKGVCPYCRLFRRHTWIDPTRPRPEAKGPSLLVTTLCELCRAPSTSDLSGYPEDVREIIRLHYASTLEDTFRDLRAWAAQRWVSYWFAAGQQRRRALREMRRLSESAESAYARQQRDYARRQSERERERARKKDPDVKLYNELLAEAQAFYGRRLKRLKRQYSEHPFPELEARLAAVRPPDYDRLYKGEPYERDVPFSPMHELGQEARSWQACAELERIILGEVTATTAGLLADCERRAREVIAAARAKHEERETRRLTEEERRREAEARRREEEEAKRRELEEARRREEEERTNRRDLIRSYFPPGTSKELIDGFLSGGRDSAAAARAKNEGRWRFERPARLGEAALPESQYIQPLDDDMIDD